ncbi:hypothetical protein SUDANB176_02368 [Streptomyces sp. enrichment culture]|uniref:SCO2400 family protein n=1 Tax=Streptomyces sp. enrichment culture TaxID=1795815 RepID=UPI003F5464FA
MDYCHPCRRHLNGALACPGCGIPVETLRARAAEPAGPAGSSECEGEPAVADAVDGPYGDEGEKAAPADGGRRGGGSRRDRKAAAHRRRRRRALLVAAGFVLAAGGLSLAELGMDAPGSPPKPAAAGEETTDGGATELEPAESPSGAAGTVPSAPSASPKDSDSPSASESPEDEESEEAGDEAEEEAEEEASSAPAGAPQTGPTKAPPPVPPSAPETPEPDPTTEKPEPEPEPTETCDRFLWWCA